MNSSSPVSLAAHIRMDDQILKPIDLGNPDDGGIIAQRIWDMAFKRPTLKSYNTKNRVITIASNLVFDGEQKNQAMIRKRFGDVQKAFDNFKSIKLDAAQSKLLNEDTVAASVHIFERVSLDNKNNVQVMLTESFAQLYPKLISHKDNKLKIVIGSYPDLAGLKSKTAICFTWLIFTHSGRGLSQMILTLDEIIKETKSKIKNKSWRFVRKDIIIPIQKQLEGTMCNFEFEIADKNPDGTAKSILFRFKSQQDIAKEKGRDYKAYAFEEHLRHVGLTKVFIREVHDKVERDTARKNGEYFDPEMFEKGDFMEEGYVNCSIIASYSFLINNTTTNKNPAGFIRDSIDNWRYENVYNQGLATKETFVLPALPNLEELTFGRQRRVIQVGKVQPVSNHQKMTGLFRKAFRYAEEHILDFLLLREDQDKLFVRVNDSMSTEELRTVIYDYLLDVYYKDNYEKIESILKGIFGQDKLNGLREKRPFLVSLVKLCIRYKMNIPEGEIQFLKESELCA